MNNFSINDFRKWMKNSEDGKRNKFIGEEVVCKFSTSKVYSKIEVQEGDEEKVLEEFSENGGIVKELDGDLFLLEISDIGTLLIPKNLVKIKD